VARQPFLDLLGWHPRDVDTLEEVLRDLAQDAEDQAAEGRLAEQRRHLRG
jgi:hypothetical protein